MKQVVEGGATKKTSSRFLGPKPPYKVCPVCGSVSAERWKNPVLDVMRRLGTYQGEIYGGAVVCELCEETVACERCRDTGFESVEYRSKNGVMVSGVRRCGCANESRVVVGLPVAYTDAMMINFDEGGGRNKSIESAQRWLSGEVSDLYIRGGVGVGKTRLMASLLNESKRNSLVSFVRVGDLVERARELLTTAGGYSDYLKQYKKVDVLGLDDIGAEKGSDFSRRVLQGLYDARLDHKKRTLFTSNFSLGDLEEFLGDERLPSRIAGNADVVFMGGQDMRVYS